MKYSLIKDFIALVEEFETLDRKPYSNDIIGFKQWMFDRMMRETKVVEEPDWKGKENGRSPESVINTLIVHMNRYAKTYSKSAIYGSDFSTQEEFIYLINLKAFGAMTKMELIKKNIQDKPAGIQIINRLIQQEWVAQMDSETDRRSKILQLTDKGLQALEAQMNKIRQATRIVAGDLSHAEKMELIRLLDKLDRFHHTIYSRNLESASLLDVVLNEHLAAKN